MRFFAHFLFAFLIITTTNSKEFRIIDFSDEGVKLLKKRGFGKNSLYK